MHQPEKIYTSPVAGEFPPLHDPDALLRAFHDVVDNAQTGEAPGVIANEVTDEPIRQVPLSVEHGIYFNHHPQALTIPQATAGRLTGLMRDWFSHYPHEPTLAQTQFGQPMLLTRFDGMISPDGTIGVCEFDDVPTGFSALRKFNPVASSYAQAVANQLGSPLHSAFLPEAGYVYPHDDHDWLPSTNGAPMPGTPVIPRARRVAPDFETFMDRWGEQSVVGAWERDCKGPLLPMGLGTVAAKLQVALDTAGVIRAGREHAVMIKGWRSSRTEAAAVVGHDKLGIRGVSTPNQVARKFAQAGIPPDSDFPLILQPFYKPPTMAELGLQFRATDAAQLAAFQDSARNEVAASQAQPGNEHKYNVLSRIYGVYLPDGARHLIVGGIWMARPSASIIHGAADAITGPLQVEGLAPYRAAR